VTAEPGEMGNVHTRALVNPTQVLATLSPFVVATRLKFAGQTSDDSSWLIRNMTPSIAAWHELGHAWGVINGRRMPQTNQEALDWENLMRQQRYGSLGSANAPRRVH
jgi:hypothetical protein